ncbi:PP2C family protein-serine/threonine phosphatase [Neobacillus sp. SM06]|uniref:PP2C family protein-serine/threonine phosphatase n=1 Tax=Neobacillus sp. SM06 TaxID=3422492 RepID=UPI003D2C7103
MDFREIMADMYRNILIHYLKDQSETTLYKGQKFSRKSIEAQIPPEEIISIHKALLQELFPDIHQDILNSFDILLEVMVGYGLAYQEHQSLRTKQMEIRSEMEIAANMQQTLLGTSIPDVKGLDIGALSVPAKHMNGDYYHFVHDDGQFLNVAIADVIGKGIPAALCMSMIKYAMDSLPETRSAPNIVLESLNRVVEQNVDPSMFISMFYGIYDLNVHAFYFSSAGHEPGFFYDKRTGQFSEIHAKGLLLGIDKKTRYSQFKKEISPGDMIILLSDGVTESRTENGFIEKETLLDYIKQYLHLSAQEIVNHVYKDLEKLQNFYLRDDFTLIILRRKV